MELNKFYTMELVIRDSEVTAAVSEPTGEAYSAYAESGKIYCENSVLVPKLGEDTTYKVLAAKAKTPVYVEVGDPVQIGSCSGAGYVCTGEWIRPGDRTFHSCHLGDAGQRSG